MKIKWKTNKIGFFKTKKVATSESQWYKVHTYPIRIIKRKKGYSAFYLSQPD
jgi:hypothetical protein